MIDLHCHVLPGVDDGPETEAEALELCRRCVDEGVRTVVATPHVSSGYPTRAETIRTGVARLNERLAETGIELEVVPGAEVSHHVLSRLSDDELAHLTLGDSRCILLEAPLSSGTVAELELHVSALQRSGFDVLLAHPERSPIFFSEPDRLRALVEGGMWCSVTGGAMEGRFGSRAERLSWRFIEEGLVHNVASDFHGLWRRTPGVDGAFAAAVEGGHHAVAAEREWLTVSAPAAILAGTPLPEMPDFGRPQGRLERWRRRIVG